MREYVSKELDKKLPQAGRPRIRWCWYWFRSAGRNIRVAWRERRPDLLSLAFYMKTRGANFWQIYVGPVDIIWPARWLDGPASVLHSKVYAEHFKAAARNDD